MEIQQGDVFWIDFDTPDDSEPGYNRPCVVVQNNLLNHSRLNTVVICAITSNLQRARFLGNVLLRQGEANLPKQSVVTVTQLYTVSRKTLGDKIGTLSQTSLKKVLQGIQLVITPTEAVDKAVDKYDKD